MSGHGTLGSGLVQKVGITHRLDSMALKDFSNLNEHVCFLLLFLKNVPWFFFVCVHDPSMIIQTQKNYFAFLPHHKDTKFISTIIIS